MIDQAHLQIALGHTGQRTAEHAHDHFDLLGSGIAGLLVAHPLLGRDGVLLLRLALEPKLLDAGIAEES